MHTYHTALTPLCSKLTFDMKSVSCRPKCQVHAFKAFSWGPGCICRACLLMLRQTSNTVQPSTTLQHHRLFSISNVSVQLLQFDIPDSTCCHASPHCTLHDRARYSSDTDWPDANELLQQLTCASRDCGKADSQKLKHRIS